MLTKPKKTILIVLRNFKQYLDFSKFLYQRFAQAPSAKRMLTFYDDRFRLHLGTAREQQRRLNAFGLSSNSNRKVQLTDGLVESHLLYKVALHMEQKTFHKFKENKEIEDAPIIGIVSPSSKRMTYED